MMGYHLYMHLFLTGERQVGKSTLDRKVLSLSRRPVMGIRSHSGIEDGDRVVYLSPILGDGKDVKAGIFRNQRAEEIYLEAFEEFGTALLSSVPSGTLVVIDEEGRLEKDAGAYSAAILSLLERDDITLFGVVQKMAETKLAEAIRKHRKVELVEVTRENWNEVFQKTKEKLS